jgi:hypothetical protein
MFLGPSFRATDFRGPPQYVVTLRWFDHQAERPHNRGILHFVRRAIVSLVLAPYVAFSATLVPEHIHEADADHPHSTVHRHLEPHHPGSHDHDHAQLTDDDGHVVWLEAVTVQQATFHFPAPQDVPHAIRYPVPLTSGWTAILNYDTAPPHGPPRASPTLRGPPHLSA